MMLSDKAGTGLRAAAGYAMEQYAMSERHAPAAEVDAAIALEKDPPKEEAKAFIAKAWFPTSSGERVVPGLGTYRKRWQSFWQSQPHLDLAPLTIVSRIL